MTNGIFPCLISFVYNMKNSDCLNIVCLTSLTLLFLEKRNENNFLALKRNFCSKSDVLVLINYHAGL